MTAEQLQAIGTIATSVLGAGVSAYIAIKQANAGSERRRKERQQELTEKYESLLIKYGEVKFQLDDEQSKNKAAIATLQAKILSLEKEVENFKIETDGKNEEIIKLSKNVIELNQLMGERINKKVKS